MDIPLANGPIPVKVEKWTYWLGSILTQVNKPTEILHGCIQGSIHWEFTSDSQDSDLQNT